MYEDYNGDVLKNETDINTEIFIEFIFGFQNPSFLLRQLHNSSGIINQKILNRAKNALIELRNAVNRKKFPKNEDSEKVIDIVEEILNFNKREKKENDFLWTLTMQTSKC